MNLLRCDNCDIELHGRDVYYDGDDSRCRHCNGLVASEDRRRKRPPGSGAQVVPLPPSVTLQRHPRDDGQHALVLAVPWRLQSPQDGLRLFGWIVVASVVLAAIQLGNGKLLAFGYGALVLLGMLLVRWINRTTIVVCKESIRVTHGPIPWRSRTLAVRNLQQLYVNRRPIAQKRFDYSVRALLEDGRDVVFLRGLKDPAAAFYLEQCIEQHLQIDDERVHGEYTLPPPPGPEAVGPYVDPAANAATQQNPPR